MSKHSRHQLLSGLRDLRRCCVEAHNRLVRDSGCSQVGELFRCLPVEHRPNSRSRQHLLVCSYAFWGSRRLGGTRRGLERRLSLTALEPYLVLHEAVKDGVFAAWQFTGEEDESRQSLWRPIGLAGVEETAVDLVADSRCEVADCHEGDMRAGWLCDLRGSEVLVFSEEIDEKAAQRLRAAAHTLAWHDEDAPEDRQFQLVEYERDVLTQSIDPGWERCGLEPLYFLPPAQRRHFPAHFRRQVVRGLLAELGGGAVSWHLLLARHDQLWVDSELRPRLDEIRKRAATKAGRYASPPVDTDVLPRLVSDENCLAMIGLESDGSVDLGRFPPIGGHPLRMLGLDDYWFDETGLGQETPINQARRHLGEDEDPTTNTFEEALARHRARLRWICIVEGAMKQEHVNPGLLRPGYRELRQVAQALFEEFATELAIGQLLSTVDAATGRVETTLRQAGIESVEDLPQRRYELSSIPGIGSKSVGALTDALRQTLLSWPPEWAPIDYDADPGAGNELAEGLDELDELFG